MCIRDKSSCYHGYRGCGKPTRDPRRTEDGSRLLTRHKRNGNITGERNMAEEKRPVLAIMRPENYREKSEALARDYGFEPLYAPMIRLEGMKDEGFEPFVQRVLAGTSDYVVFTSANGISFTLEKFSENE